MIYPKIQLFKLSNLKKGKFLNRQNRFVGTIKYNDEIEFAHIHDPGRLKELLLNGAEVLFTKSNGKLKYYINTLHIIKIENI